MKDKSTPSPHPPAQDKSMSFDTVIESLELQSDPELMERLAESRKEYDANLARPIEELDLE